MDDMQMAKAALEPGEIDLAVGEPTSLRETVFQVLYNAASLDWGSQGCHGRPWEEHYPALGGNYDLLEELAILHPDKHIVVTNGAKQGLLASFQAFGELYGLPSVFHSTPYWPSFPTLAKLAGMKFSSVAGALRVVTCPNNPDGALVDSNAGCAIWDASYAHQAYGWNPANTPTHGVSVWSAAKMFGYSSSRVGWVVCDDEKVANTVARFVEAQTSGVAASPQTTVAALLRASRIYPDKYAMAVAAARHQLAWRCSDFWKYAQTDGSLFDQVKGAPATGIGMFAFVHAKEPERFERARQLAKVRMVTGEACGLKERGWYRINMGVMVHEGLKPLRQSYESLS